MASIPLDLSTTRSSRKTTPLKMIPTFEQPRWHLMPNPGILLRVNWIHTTVNFMFLIHTITIRQTGLVPLQFRGCLKNAIMYARCCRGSTVRLLYFRIANFALHFVPQPERISRRRDLLQREFLSASPTRSSLRSQSVTLDGGATPVRR